MNRCTSLVALAAAGLVTMGAPAAAQAPSSTPAASAAGAAVKLFPDSRIVVRDRFSVEVVGKGPDIVLIPGLASSRETWRATAERLRGRYRLHLVNVAGFAGEPSRANAMGPVFVPTAEAIDAYLAQLHRPIVIGHSLGGTMILWLAENHPEHISKALIVDSLPFLGALIGGPTATSETVRPMAEGMRNQMMAAPGFDRTANRPMIQGMVTAPTDVDRVLDWGAASDKSVVARAMAEDMMLDLRPGLGKITTPIVLLYPDTAGPTAAPQMMDGMYQAAYAPAKTIKPVRIDGSRHFISYDQPARFYEQLDRLLGS